MRTVLKTACLETVSILEEAHAEIEKCIRNGDSAQAAAFLEECQQGAIGIGNAIEESEGEGTAEVRELEAYCETVFRLHEAQTVAGEAGRGNDAMHLLQDMKRSLTKAADGIRNLPLTKEVVFLPYKASMWDSLEPVWRKMKEDPSVNALVIPIPYYDKNPDGSVREMHYEADKYPEDVPVISYRNYSLQERHPDAIYIHNPYDDANYVTSVLPEFYSSRIKEFTDELVYIPYFVLDEIDPQLEAVVEANAHFIRVPAVLHAHRVIVQSENWRQAYINVMTAFAGENTRPYWEKKIEAGGSPKLERAANLTEADFVMPKDWERFVFRADGSRRKVILYNTGLTAMLEQNEAMLDKIERNLEVFREHREDVVLLWRPHPLLESTLQSMRPELLARFKTIVDAYRNEALGIYDDSAELDRAIALSDAYYGDPSSVVHLYKQTGKPIMIQNVCV